MEAKDILNNVIDELERAIQRITELGEFEDNSITGDEELVTDMEISINRLYHIIDIID